MPVTQASLHSSPRQARRRQSTTHQGNDIEAGCILWLPRKDNIEERLLTNIEIDDGCFHHPVVVLSIELAPPARRKATVLILTSFGGQDLAVKYPTKSHQRDHHLPISPSAAHPDNGILLSLQNNAELRQLSYIKTEYGYTINAASLEPYCRSGKEYKLKKASYNILKAYTKFVSPTTRPIPHSDQFDRSSVHPSTSSLDGLTAPHSYLRTAQRTLSQIPSTPHIPATSRLVSTRPLQAPIYPPAYQARVVPGMWQDPDMYKDTQRNRRALLLPYTEPSSVPSPSVPEPEFPGVTEFIIPLLVLGSVGAITYGRYRLLNLGKWILKEMKGRWNDRRMTFMRESGLQFIRAILKGSVSMVCSVDRRALFDSIKNRIGGIQQGLEAHLVHIYRYFGNYRAILSRLVEGTLNLLNPS